jgi:hypothetical protein
MLGSVLLGTRAVRAWWRRWPSRPRAPSAARSDARSCAVCSAASWRIAPPLSGAVIAARAGRRAAAELSRIDL